jgi:hypothetical protein
VNAKFFIHENNKNVIYRFVAPIFKIRREISFEVGLVHHHAVEVILILQAYLRRKQADMYSKSISLLFPLPLRPISTPLNHIYDDMYVCVYVNSPALW